jgi:hypothetical protein
MTTETTAAPWTLRFTEWQCGHHGQRPEDIPVASPEQAKAILWAIACAISQPGHARAMLFDETRGYPDIYLTDDYVSAGYASDFDTERAPSERPVVVLCSDEATASAILAPELTAAREEISDPDLWRATVWDGKAQVDTYETVLTTLTREAIVALEKEADPWPHERPPLFALPPVFRDGAELLARLRTIPTEIAALCTEVEGDQPPDRTLTARAP